MRKLLLAVVWAALFAGMPGFIPSAWAQKAETSGDIVDLVNQQKIEVATQGSSIRAVHVRMRPVASGNIRVIIPVGTFFASSSSSVQNMVTTREQSVVLKQKSWTTVSVPAACANRTRDIPEKNDTFEVQRSPDQEELRRVSPFLRQAGAHYATEQAAVWIVTDDASYEDLGILQNNGSRVIEAEEVIAALRILDAAGIDITRKQIWKDIWDLIPHLKNGKTKKWIHQWLSHPPAGHASVWNEALFEAANTTNLELVRALLASKTDANARKEGGAAALLGAAHPRDEFGGQLACFSPPEEWKHSKQYALSYAVAKASLGECLGIVRALIAAGADVNAGTAFGETPLMVASEHGHADIVRILLAAKADANAGTKMGGTALQAAAGNGHLDVVKLLLAAKADVNIKTKWGGTALMEAAGADKNGAKIVQLLLVAGAGVNDKTDDNGTALLRASRKHNAPVVRLLLQSGAEVNAADKKRETALMHAAKGAQAEIVRMLVDAGADVNMKDKEGVSALLLAVESAKSGNFEENEVKDRKGKSLDMVRVLLAAKADVNAVTNDGWTALMSASGMGLPDIVKALLEAGADFTPTSRNGRTALKQAIKFERQDVVELLTAAGAKQ